MRWVAGYDSARDGASLRAIFRDLELGPNYLETDSIRFIDPRLGLRMAGRTPAKPEGLPARGAAFRPGRRR